MRYEASIYLLGGRRTHLCARQVDRLGEVIVAQGVNDAPHALVADRVIRQVQTAAHIKHQSSLSGSSTYVL